MDRLLDKDNPDYSDDELYLLCGSYVTLEQYYGHMIPDSAFDPCIESVMFNASNQELDDFIKHGDEDEKRQAKMEIAVRDCETKF